MVTTAVVTVKQAIASIFLAVVRSLFCGGTFLQANGTTIISETVWNDNSQSSATGCGLSQVLSKPSYQNNLSYPLNNMRGVPDVTSDGDPNSGYIIYMNGSSFVIGGTSRECPIMDLVFLRALFKISLNRSDLFIQSFMLVAKIYVEI